MSKIHQNYVTKSIILSGMSDKKPMLLPERIKEEMNRRGWDVGILAYQSGVKTNTIYKYLKGTRKVDATLSNLAYIARALGCSVEYLINMTDIKQSAIVMELSAEQRDVIHKMGELSSRRQREFASYLRLLLDMDAQDREWIKRNLDANKKLLDFINFVGGEDAFFDLLNSLGKQSSSSANVEGEDDDQDDPDDADDSDEASEDKLED